MQKPQRPRKLLTSAVRVATLVVVGVAETACNLVVSHLGDAGHDTGTPPATDAASPADANVDTGAP